MLVITNAVMVNVDHTLKILRRVLFDRSENLLVCYANLALGVLHSEPNKDPDLVDNDGSVCFNRDLGKPHN